MEGIQKHPPYLFQQRFLRDAGKHGYILLRILHMDREPARIPFIPGGRGFHNGVEYGLLAGKMIIKGGGPDPHGGGDLSYAYRIIAPLGKQLQGLIQYSLLGIRLHHCPPVAN